LLIANYAIPITVPPGISGMKPELSINYNSNSGNGLLGVGFGSLLSILIFIIVNPWLCALFLQILS
jgi:hypothetical protein